MACCYGSCMRSSTGNVSPLAKTDEWLAATGPPLEREDAPSQPLERTTKLGRLDRHGASGASVGRREDTSEGVHGLYFSLFLVLSLFSVVFLDICFWLRRVTMDVGMRVEG